MGVIASCSDIGDIVPNLQQGDGCQGNREEGQDTEGLRWCVSVKHTMASYSENLILLYSGACLYIQCLNTKAVEL
jgi:hypothetical protein